MNQFNINFAHELSLLGDGNLRALFTSLAQNIMQRR